MWWLVATGQRSILRIFKTEKTELGTVHNQAHRRAVWGIVQIMQIYACNTSGRGLETVLIASAGEPAMLPPLPMIAVSAAVATVTDATRVRRSGSRVLQKREIIDGFRAN